jgi:Aldose 1-epimerase
MPWLVNEDSKMYKTNAWRAGNSALAWSLLTVAMVPAISLTASGTKAHITAAAFGRLPDGRAVELYTLHNRRGMEARIMTYGGIVTYLSAPDIHGHFADVVLGYDSLTGYLRESPYFGALIGRYGTHKSLDASRHMQVTR